MILISGILQERDKAILADCLIGHEGRVRAKPLWIPRSAIKSHDADALEVRSWLRAAKLAEIAPWTFATERPAIIEARWTAAMQAILEEILDEE